MLFSLPGSDGNSAARSRRRNGTYRAQGSARTVRCEPTLVPDFIALRGDPSDKLPGATGVARRRVQPDLLR